MDPNGHKSREIGDFCNYFDPDFKDSVVPSVCGHEKRAEIIEMPGLGSQTIFVKDRD